MIHVLHLIDAAADFQTMRCAHHLSTQLGDGFSTQVRTIGRGGYYASIIAAIRDLRRTAGFHLIHCWGMRPLSAAIMGSGLPLLYSPPPEPDRRQADWLRAALRYRDVQTICPTAAMQHAMLTAGVPATKCHVIRPGVEFARIQRRRDPELRKRLGLAHDDQVLLAAGESTIGAAHDDAVWAASILHVLDSRWKLLLWGRGGRSEACVRFARKLGSEAMLRMAEPLLGERLEFEQLLPASDMVVISATRTVATLPISIAMAAALPIVSSVTLTTSELLEDRHTAMMTPSASPRMMAQRILRLREDGGLQWRLTDMARNEAYAYYALTRFLDQYRTVYRQLAEGRAVEAPEPAAAAGLRFHGRA